MSIKDIETVFLLSEEEVEERDWEQEELDEREAKRQKEADGLEESVIGE